MFLAGQLYNISGSLQESYNPSSAVGSTDAATGIQRMSRRPRNLQQPNEFSTFQGTAPRRLRLQSKLVTPASCSSNTCRENGGWRNNDTPSISSKVKWFIKWNVHIEPILVQTVKLWTAIDMTCRWKKLQKTRLLEVIVPVMVVLRRSPRLMLWNSPRCLMQSPGAVVKLPRKRAQSQ